MLRYLLLIPIKIYWFLIPPAKRNRCLFKESCSNFVFNSAKDDGFLKGIKALMFRYKNCRPGYQIMKVGNKTYMISANHEMFPLKDLRDSILK